MLYAKYLGINGSLFEAKVLGLQFMTVLLQVGGYPLARKKQLADAPHVEAVEGSRLF